MRPYLFWKKLRKVFWTFKNFSFRIVFRKQRRRVHWILGCNWEVYILQHQRDKESKKYYNLILSLMCIILFLQESNPHLTPIFLPLSNIHMLEGGLLILNYHGFVVWCKEGKIRKFRIILLLIKWLSRIIDHEVIWYLIFSVYKRNYS